jgi:hypothetical protein
MPGFDFDQQPGCLVEAFPDLGYGFHKPRALFHSFTQLAEVSTQSRKTVFGQNQRQPVPEADGISSESFHLL